MSIRPPIFKPNKPKIGPEIQYSERLQRVIRAHRDIEFEYQLNTRDLREEVLYSRYAEKYPDQIQRKLATFSRVKIPQANWFELEDGTLDTDHKVKECLVWSESRTIFDPKFPGILSEAFIQSQVLYGIYRKPYAIVQRDEWGNPIENKTKIAGYKNIFYIEFNEKNVNEVLEQFGGKYRNTTLAYGVQGEAWYEMPTLGVPNLTDWIHEDFDLLIKANKAGTLMEEPGVGVRLFLKKEQDRKNKIMKELEESENVRSGVTQSKSRK